MARKFRGWQVAVVSAVALIGIGCGNTGDSDKGSTAGDGAGSESADGGSRELAKSDCGKLPDEDAPEGGDFVDYAWLSDAGTNTSFDPGVVQTLSESQITTALFDGLTDFDFTEKCAPVLKPLVAEKWEANDDATEFTFTIKKDLKFSNGDPVLPSSFKLGWERAGSKELASPYGYLIGYVKGGADLQEGKITALDSVVADDEGMTLKVTLESPNADFPAIVTHPFFGPITTTEYDKVKNTTGWGKGITIGNGPFKLQKADDTEVVLVPNDNWAGNVYGDTKPKLATLTFKITQDVDSAYQAFEAGEGMSATVPSGKYKQAREAYGNTLDSPNLGVYYFDFGFADPQLGGPENLKLRQAISLAIDRDEINTKVFEGSRTVATGLTPPGIPGFEEGACKYCAHDPEEAKKLFGEWEDAGGELTSPIKVDYNEGGSHGDVVQIIIANLKDTLGIDAVAAPVAEDYFKVVAAEGGCHFCRSGWYADYPTYGNFMVDLFSKASIDGNNFARFDNPDFEKLIADAQAEPDADKRGELYREAEDLLLNTETAAVPLNWYKSNTVFRDGVVNYDAPPLGLLLWERVGLKK